MELGWNTARPDAGADGEKAKPNTSDSGQGLEIKETFSTSGRGRKMSLTSPLIDQAFTVRREKALVHSVRKDPPGNWIAPPGSNRSGGGGNKAAGASGVEGRIRRHGESAGCNVVNR